MDRTFWDEVGRHIGEATGAAFRGRPAGSVGGGCINRAEKLVDVDGLRAFFVKRNRADLLAMFEAEADGLAALAKAGAIRAPRPVCWGEAAGEAFLAIEWLELGGRGDWSRMGQELAALHRAPAGARFGWGRDNFIGATSQVNGWRDDWPAFFAESRLGYQFELAARRGARFEGVDRLLASVPEIVGDDVAPSLLHGDLWSGNAGFADGAPAIFDPAVYVGDREADLAMTELFGGFPRAFYEGYDRVWPRRPGYAKRRELYNLYHVLNHFNLFGGGYANQAARMIAALLA